ncbi:MAG: hypothetical protein HY897_00130 [Deltaproteobacteria bacterium]|nr:hypothetical protein [Deltaproteobacteria bacterium]
MSEEFMCAGAAVGGCPSDLVLDVFMLDAQAVGEPVRAHFGSCGRCVRRVVEYERIRETFMTEVAPSTEGLVAGELSRGRNLLTAIFDALAPIGRIPRLGYVSTALTAILLVGLWNLAGNEPTYIGAKGGLSVEVYAKRGERVFRVKDGDTLRPGDMLRFISGVPKAGYLMIVSIEEGGAVNLFYPQNGESAMNVNERSSGPLAGSVILDEKAGLERVFVLFSELPFDFKEVRTAARLRLDSVPSAMNLTRLPSKFEQTSILFRKGGR